MDKVFTRRAPRWFPGFECIHVSAAAKMPDIIIDDVKRNWLALIEAVAGAGPVYAQRRSELKLLLKASKAGLVFVTNFKTRKATDAFLGQISRKSVQRTF